MYWIQWAEKTFKHSCLMNGWRWLALVDFEVWPFPDRHSRGQGEGTSTPKVSNQNSLLNVGGDYGCSLKSTLFYVNIMIYVYIYIFMCFSRCADDSLICSKGYLWLPTIKSFSNNIRTPFDLVAGGTRITFISLEWRQSNTRGDWIVQFWEIFSGKRWKIGVEICRSTKT